MKCEYCGTDKQTGERCERCGAKLPESRSEPWKSAPIFYNGYILYMIRDLVADVFEVQFWLGQDLIERIVVPGLLLRERVSPESSFMPFFWELFLIARGEQEVMRVVEKNNKYPARFEIRRIENPEKEYLFSLDNHRLWEEIIKAYGL